SLSELSKHAGRPLETVGDIVAAAEGLRNLGPNAAVLVSLGGEGAVLVAAGEPPIAITAPPVTVMSVVGAGDSLVAGLVLALAAGEPLSVAARRGVAAGSAATIAEG